MNFKKNLVTWLLLFLGFILIFNMFSGKKEEAAPANTGPLTIETLKPDYSVGSTVIIELKNNTSSPITFENPCPRNPFQVVYLSEANPRVIEAETELNCEEFQNIVVEAGEKTKVTYAYWARKIFAESGRYRIEAPVEIDNEIQTIISNEFLIEEKGIVKTAWEKFLYQPLYNALMFLVDKTPGKNLGIGIILLTLIVRLILLVPSQRGIKAQLRMQQIQPKLKAIQKKYKGNQERISKETMKIWKENKVNPFGSCLPLLIQFPILIAIFYAIRNGLNPDTLTILYSPLQNIHLADINVNFLGLNLIKVNAIILPLVVGFLQYMQMKLSLAIKSKKDEKGGDEKGEKPAGGMSEMQSANKIMIYAMPVMIAVFTATMPAGVGLYWGISTLFGIGQQLVANRGPVKVA